MQAYYQRDGITIYLGNCMDVMQEIRNVDHVITDPPYNVRADDIALEGRSAMKRDFGEWDQEWQAVPFLNQVIQLIAPGGSLLSFTSDRLLSSFREADGWKPRGTIVWVKTNPAPHPRPAYVQATEFIVWLQRDGAPAVWNGTGYTLNVLTYGACSGLERTKHPTQKPESLLCDLITRHTNAGEMILDPFMGSGTTLVAAKRLGRQAIGIDADEQWCEIAAKRLSQSSLFEQTEAPSEPVNQGFDL